MAGGCWGGGTTLAFKASYDSGAHPPPAASLFCLLTFHGIQPSSWKLPTPLPLPEHGVLPIPDTLLLCHRCHLHNNQSDAWCVWQGEGKIATMRKLKPVQCIHWECMSDDKENISRWQNGEMFLESALASPFCVLHTVLACGPVEDQSGL